VSLSSVVRCGVIGYGYWGPNVVRNVMECGDVRVQMIADASRDRLGHASQRYPSVETTTDAMDVISSVDVDAVIIATPVSTHYELAHAAIKAGKHVLVEKPISQNVEQALTLIEAARARGLTLMVDHTFIYTGAVMKLAEIARNGDLGTMYYYDSTRANLGLFQQDVNVIYDLAVHDLSILDHVLMEKPIEVSAVGASHLPSAPQNVAFITLFYESGLIAHINVNWLSPVKVRRAHICGSQRMVVYDDVEPSEKIKIYDKGVDFTQDISSIHRLLISYRSGDMRAPYLDQREALNRVVAHFADCIRNGVSPITDGAMGARVLQYMIAACVSMEARGRPQQLQSL